MLAIDVSGDTRKVKEQLAAIQEKISHPHPAYRMASLRMYRDVIEHFRDEKNPDGSPWAEWSDEYAAHRKGTKKLQDRGILRASIFFQGLENDARVYTEIAYAATHQWGRGGIPARTFMWLSDGALKSIEFDWAKWIVGQIDFTGL